MAEYKIIFKADLKTEGNNALTWEPGCPALVTAIQVSRNTETSATYLQVKVRNVSDAAISSIFAGLEVSLPDGSVDRVPLEYLDVDLPAGAEAALKPMSLSHSDISSCALAISRIDQASSKWQTSAPAQPLPERETLPYLSSRAIDQRARALNAKADDDILRGAVQDHGDWWVCACGQVNVSRDTCCDCKREKALLLANEDETKLLADAAAFDEQTYNEAVKLQEEGTLKTLKQAAAKFDSLGQYNDAGKRASNCKAEIARLTGAKNRRFKTILITACAIAALVVIAGIVFTQVVVPLQEQAAEEARIAEEQARVSEEIQALSTAQIGSTVEFGHYEQDNDESNGAEPVSWILLAVEDGKALLLAEKGLDFKQYNSAVKSSKYTYVYNCEYASSQVKTWLEQEFETQVFSEKELALLTDSATLLTEDEFNNLVPDAYRKCSLTECAYQKRLTYQQQKQYTSIDYEYESEWWLKSGKSEWCALIEKDGSTHDGIMPTVSFAVRPAIWVNVNTSNGQ
jgi:hypothetical protein